RRIAAREEHGLLRQRCVALQGRHRLAEALEPVREPRRSDDVADQRVDEEERGRLPGLAPPPGPTLPHRTHVRGVYLDALAVHRRLGEVAAHRVEEAALLARHHRVELEARAIEGVGALESAAAVGAEEGEAPAYQVRASEVELACLR